MSLPPDKTDYPTDKVPMILSLPPSAIIYAVNLAREAEGRELIPVDATISVEAPEGEDLELDEGSVKLDIRWEV